MSTGLPPSGEYLGGYTIEGTSRSTPIAFSVRGWTNGLLVSIYACLAHMYMEKQGWTHFTTRSFTSGSIPHVYTCARIFLTVIAVMCEEGHTRDLCFASMVLPPHLYT